MAESFCKSLETGQEYEYVIDKIKPTMSFAKHDILMIPTSRNAETWSGLAQVRWREHLSRFDLVCNIVVQDGKVVKSYLSSRDNS